MEFNWIKDERDYFRRNCKFQNGDWIFVCRQKNKFYWHINFYNDRSVNLYKLEINEEDFPKTMKEAKEQAQKEYLKQINYA